MKKGDPLDSVVLRNSSDPHVRNFMLRIVMNGLAFGRIGWLRMGPSDFSYNTAVEFRFLEAFGCFLQSSYHLLNFCQISSFCYYC
jgi:hypothetical protein